MALFEVYQDGVCKMATDYHKCIYPMQTLLSMKSAGCTFKYEGKRYVPKKGEKELFNAKK